MAVTLLMIMIIITLLLWAFAIQVTSPTTDFVPVKILTDQKNISENSDLYVTCSTFGLKKNTMVYLYLCKNDIWIDHKKQKEDRDDTLFIIRNVSLNHSGKYSCVFSIKNDLLPKAPMRGLNVIQILVIPNYLPADISIAGPLAVSEGDDVAFRCSVSDTLQTLGGCPFIHSHLRRNETLVQVQTFNVNRMEATFTIQGAVSRDGGHYSCVVLPSKCVPEHEATLRGNNAVLLVVKESVVDRAMVSCGVGALMLVVGLCLWWIHKQRKIIEEKSKAAFSASFNAARRQEESEVEDVESQDGDSFASEGDDYQNIVHGAVSINFENCVALYSAVDDPPAAALYSLSCKKAP
uniref:uncharacterized protein LOC120810754 n=1 Tax=Gasterosteus aculeatus aculeatus TaxID=481459 RepID=UPI001A9A0103|nr:uncharacterized protein LOC120810754 [Gasterosteus aculeatus aculeatus]